jgi:UDP-hydrolysing UDP-N-acetyl-D-glucosamine 2-epimerase
VIRESLCLPNVDVHIIVGASGLLYRFGDVSRIIEQDGFAIENKIFTVVEGENPVSMAKTTGLSLISLADEFSRLRPDVVVTVADRYETIATAIAASYMNISVAHTQGGEVTGSIDDSVRHAITKLSHMHFPATVVAEENLLRLGEDPNSIYRVGCPAIDLAFELPERNVSDVMSRYRGVGYEIDFSQPYLLVSQHPDTLEFESARNQISQTLAAIEVMGIQTVWLWPNVDSGSDSISKRLREHRESSGSSKIAFYRNFSAEDYLHVLRGSLCIVGNSSSGLREASFLGIPAVNIGERQRGRERGINVIDVGYADIEIQSAITKSLSRRGLVQDNLYGNGDAGKKMAHILSICELTVRKPPLA